MQIRTFKAIEYKGHKIIIRNMHHTFEYLVAINGEIYAFHCTIRPDFLNRVLCFLRRQELPYSKEQLEGLILKLSQTAEITVDTILNPPPAEDMEAAKA